MATSIQVGVERGSKRVFSCAVDWPGWCRSGKDEDSALAALREYVARYGAVVRGSGVRFPSSVELDVAERVDGNATTDFGAPDAIFDSDEARLDRRALTRTLKLFDACWSAFDDAVVAARGLELRKGPRGGGRELDGIVDHVMQAEAGYGRMLAARVSFEDGDPWAARVGERDQIRAALTAAVMEGMPAAGPRGGKLWTPRRFVRRGAWHVLDHAWEIEDRAGPPDS